MEADLQPGTLKRLVPHAAAVTVLALAAMVGVITGPASGADVSEGVAGAGAAEPKGAKPCQWRVVWTTKPATEAMICWSTAQETTTNKVYFDTQPRSGDLAKYAQQQAATTNGRYSSRRHSLYYHYAPLTGLTPDSLCYFTVSSDKEVSREFHFRTAPDQDVDFKFLYGGDSRSDRDGRRTMNIRMRTLLAQDPAILCLVHGGDYVYDGDDMELWSEWLTDHELTVTAAGRMLPVVPARGNHEAGDIQFDEVFASPGGTGLNYFLTPLSPQLFVISLNTEISAAGDQAKFLQSRLKENTAVRWQLANYHRPAYPAVKEPSVAKQHWVPLFDEYNLDVAFESDGHTIKRTRPVRGDKPSDDGVVYIGEGGLGVKQRTPDADRWYFEGGKVGASSHVQKVTVTSTQLKVETILHDGSVFDTWQKPPRKR